MLAIRSNDAEAPPQTQCAAAHNWRAAELLRAALGQQPLLVPASDPDFCGVWSKYPKLIYPECQSKIKYQSHWPSCCILFIL